MNTAILQIIAIGAKIFSDERQRYFEKKSKELQEEIYKVEDTDFYNKDMEAKGRAEREIARRTDELMMNFIKEGNK
jgi:hypothetical protein